MNRREALTTAAAALVAGGCTHKEPKPHGPPVPRDPYDPQDCAANYKALIAGHHFHNALLDAIKDHDDEADGECDCEFCADAYPYAASLDILLSVLESPLYYNEAAMQARDETGSLVPHLEPDQRAVYLGQIFVNALDVAYKAHPSKCRCGFCRDCWWMGYVVQGYVDLMGGSIVPTSELFIIQYGEDNPVVPLMKALCEGNSRAS
jgi:hypothetical protein